MLLNSLKSKQITRLCFGYAVKYSTRQQLYYSSIDQEVIQKEEKERQINNLKQKIYSIKSNDSNPDNYIKVKIQEKLPEYVPKSNEPFIVKKQMPIQNKILQARRGGFVSSIKKMTEALRGLSKLHIATAIYTLEQSEKKVAKLLLPTLYGLLSTARLRGLQLHRIFIHRVLIGKQRRFASIRYHAKGKSGRMETDLCCVKVIIQQRNQQRFYREMSQGKIDLGLAQQLKQDLLAKKAPLQEVQKYKDILTSKGRQQYKMLVQRKIDHIFEQKKRKGQPQARKKIQIQILKQQAERFKELLTSRIEVYSQLKEREQKYIQNTQKKGRY